MVVDLYTDGACSGNPGPGGWGWVTPDGRNGRGGAKHTTNQRMEVQAVLEGLRSIEGPVKIVSDSTYVVKCFNDQWYEGWMKRGWKNSQKKPVANRDLWEPLIELYLARKDELSFQWVKGHSGDRFNELADDLAVAARDEQLAEDRLQSKEGSLDEAPVPWPVEQAIWAVGEAGAVGSSLVPKMRSALSEALSRLDRSNDLLVSGLRRGLELEAAEIALSCGIKVAVVLPFDNPAGGWPDPTRQRFDQVRRNASWEVTLSGDPSKPGQAVESRDQWLAQAVVGAIVVGLPATAKALDELGLSVVEVG